MNVSEQDKIEIANMIAREFDAIIEARLEHLRKVTAQERQGLTAWADEECERITGHAEDVVRQEAMNVAAMMSGGIARAA